MSDDNGDPDRLILMIVVMKCCTWIFEVMFLFTEGIFKYYTFLIIIIYI